MEGEKNLRKMKWLDGITNKMDMNSDKLQEMVQKEAWYALVDEAIKNPDMTWQVNNRGAHLHPSLGLCRYNQVTGIRRIVMEVARNGQVWIHFEGVEPINLMQKNCPWNMREGSSRFWPETLEESVACLNGQDHGAVGVGEV